ncbi:FAD:protein FMN transferase [Paenibacillus lentus]|uniref:FAD:protein FMN transferase n=1 Tax=Paenibacillus lentus TaxID=1338368 RepID=A0A3Q8S3E8_9BACL|nr:FAD:protein FMN transferase [Paenibacillus lentus]AZK44926.1 FAD:protein FMN transferase [Paenibacillus lentus]
MNHNRLITLGLTVLLSMTLLAGCGTNSNPSTNSVSKNQKTANDHESIKPMAETFFIFDTVVNVKIYDNRATREHFNEIEALLKDIDSKISRTLESSEIYQVNVNSGKSAVKVSSETFELVIKALDYAKRTDGKFNPAIGNLVTLWNIGHENAKVPDANLIEAARTLNDYRLIDLNQDTQEIYLQKEGMAIDLGSIGKGYAADAIYDYLQEQGFSSAIIDLGGNIYAMGQKPGGKMWNIGIQDPDKNRGNSIGTLQVEDKTVVTSGIYERFFIEDGKLYQHILDPETGYPVDNGISSVTVVTKHSTDADALSTTLFVLGIEEGLKFIEDTPDTEALFISKEQKLYATSGFKNMLNKTNDSYTFAN